VATSRMDMPEYTYVVTPGDVGYYIMAEVTPKVLNSQPGTMGSATTDRVITAEDLPLAVISTNFQNFPTEVQNLVKPGFWTVEGFKPADTAEYDWKAKTGVAWAYSVGEGGAKNVYGLTQTVRGSRILYTPAEGSYGNMSVTLQVAPCKSAGQGFGSATAQYMDVLLKMDTENLNGYALRIERTGKYSNAVDFKLIKYSNGMTEAITEPVSASCYNTLCTITLKAEGAILSAHVETTKKQNDEQAAAGLAHVVDLSAEIETNNFGGVGVTHTGTVGANATLLTQLDVVWEEAEDVAAEPTPEPTVEPSEIPEKNEHVDETEANPTEAPTVAPTQAPEATKIPENGDVISTDGGDRQVVTGMPGFIKYMIVSLVSVIVLAVIAIIYSAVKPRKPWERNK